MSISKWYRFGDINPIENSGMFIRRNKKEFDIIEIVGISETCADFILYGEVTLNIEDSWINRKRVMIMSGKNPNEITSMEFAKLVIDYYGVERAGGIVSKEKPQSVAKILKRYGIVYNE